MKKKTIRIVITMVLVLGLLLMSSCTSENTTEQKTSEPTTETKETTTESTATEESVQEGPFLKFDEPIDLSVIFIADQTVKFYEGEGLENNVWFNAYRDALNINISYLWVAADGEQYNQKMNIMVASDEIPDLIDIRQPLIFSQLAEAGKLADLTGMLEMYATETVQQQIESYGEAIAEAVKFDDKVYAFPLASGGVNGGMLLWLKQDWLDTYDLDAPSTMDELIDLAYKFAELDPTGTGTYGLALCKNLFGSGFAVLEGICAGYGAYPEIWHRDSSGQIVYGSTTPEMRTSLEMVAKLFADGLIDPEFGVKDGGKVGETVAQNKVGILTGASWNSIWPLNSNVAEDETALWQAHDIVYAQGVENKVPSSLNIGKYYAINADYEHPEALYAIANFTSEMLYGSDPSNAEKFGWAADGMELFKYRVMDYEPLGKGMIAAGKIEEAMETGDTSLLNGEEKVYYKNVVGFLDGDRSLFGHYGAFGPNGSTHVNLKWAAEDRMLYNILVGSPVEAWIDKGSTLTDLRLEIFTKIITGEEPIETFDKYVENWNALGGEEATKQMNERYK